MVHLQKEKRREQITRRMKEQNCKEDYLDMAVVLAEISEMPVDIINNVLDIVVMEAEEQTTKQGQTVKVEEQITRTVKEQNWKEDYLDMAVVLTKIFEMTMEIIDHGLDIVVREAVEQKAEQWAGQAPIKERESRKWIREEWSFHPLGAWTPQPRRQPGTRAMIARRERDRNLYSRREN